MPDACVVDNDVGHAVFGADLLCEPFDGFGVSDVEGIALRRAALAQSGLPCVAEAAPYLARLDKEAEFDFAVDLAINLMGRLASQLS